MNVIIALEQRFESTPDRKVWTPGLFAHSFWRRYLDVFDHVRVVARVCRVAAATPGWAEADGPGVSFVPVTYYLGPWQYLRRRRRIRADVRGVLGPSDAVILRVCSQVAACLEPQLRRGGRPYGVEVVGDPYDVFAPGAVVHPLRRSSAGGSPRQLRRQCAGPAGPFTSRTGPTTSVSLPRRVSATSYSSVGLRRLFQVAGGLVDALFQCGAVGDRRRPASSGAHEVDHGRLLGAIVQGTGCSCRLHSPFALKMD